MGNENRNSWLDAVRRAFRSTSGDERKTGTRIKVEQKKRRNWRWLDRRNYYLETTIQHNAERIESQQGVLFAKQPQMENIVSQERRAIAVAMATTAAAAIKTAQAAVQVIHLARSTILIKEHDAAIVIQRSFRGYLARTALLALKGVVKLQALIRGYNVRKRAKMTLQCFQSLLRVQALVCDQRRRLSFEATSPRYMLSEARRHRDVFMCVRDHEELEEAERSPDMNKILPFARNERNSCLFPAGSPKTPSSCTIKKIQVHSCSPRCYTKEAGNYQPSETSCSFYSPRTSMSMSGTCNSSSRPNYMATTASATARVMSIGTPRMSPSREQMSATKKKLLFPEQNSEEYRKQQAYV